MHVVPHIFFCYDDVHICVLYVKFDFHCPSAYKSIQNTASQQGFLGVQKQSHIYGQAYFPVYVGR